MTSPSDAKRRLLLVHAHPDDESINNGVTMARYAAEGAHVTLVTCTLGEEGEILVPELAHLAREDRLGEHRIGELANAMRALGVTDHRFLGAPGKYRDSGMMGTPANERPDCFWRADLDEAAADLVAVVREVRPQVLVTYDENGGYGHPDHIQAHRVAMRAADLAADPRFRPDLGAPWEIAKIYWNAVPRSVVEQGLDALRQAAGEIPFAVPEDPAELVIAVDDALITTVIDGTEHAEAKRAALRAHATQIAVDGFFFALTNNLGQWILATEYYRLARGQAVPGPDGRETDLFAGVA
ncbi:N-acetyl-1-D-myo-inositol-2-amino-2-deoxy-alpha-D-glucopyranoside deacetylase [Carbonactinospora thermoautotrophica]|uniref:1D-myo-inositol 2-acetamido-2-deoxy-alpha-D-glucopyranoside deacetylase n=1 Tax=Carbonactinospora thermoautotrophica TaxID=1469144 RepID=A0A132N5Z8_9ACTN|nr:N-acetyl-1-D-myo-inositol-2-amino-2-deoxy-alpha-D-glucopyranoside deacetylase [Carbonactinospora thermoautotrophica]KWX04972.1 1D-myo-inositol 2-acetamido-2-deoxy-alpha-D-glucopyranoside deacetylase [Carbonactinospora thermoautotrophica]MCX9193714.1 N-acetyl-1-D-myo-inositol-2-amino-2-deoxy-alpha-D-glucopyranoside deacetylase [Carbonactinospora thermoautotrophica]